MKGKLAAKNWVSIIGISTTGGNGKINHDSWTWEFMQYVLHMSFTHEFYTWVLCLGLCTEKILLINRNYTHDMKSFLKKKI